MEEIRTVQSERGKKLLLVKNFKYYKKDLLKSSGEEKWCCTVRGCTAKLYIIYIDSTPVISRQDGAHNHESDEKKVQRQILSESCKRKAEQDLFVGPSKLCRNVLGGLSEAKSNLLLTSDINNVKRTIYNVRRKKFPILPKSTEEVHCKVGDSNFLTNYKENFVLDNDVTRNIIVFSCKTNLKFLCTCEAVFMDGTFSYCAKFFKQLFTIHGYQNGHYVPLVFCLINDKSAVSYQACLKKIIAQCERIDLSFKPQKIVIDFELSIHTAVLKVWPKVEIVGCRFHLSQSWWRKIQELGLAAEYRKKPKPENF